MPFAGLCIIDNVYENDKIIKTNHSFRVTLVVEYLGYVDLDLGSSLGWWAATLAT